MPRITNKEIAKLKDGLENWMSTSGHNRLTAALDRLAELETAVAWHGFDELPHATVIIELRKDRKTTLDNISVMRDIRWSSSSQEFEFPLKVIANPRISINDVISRGFTGWRYPVGDLS